ncbi:MAG: hypothetical protein WDN08_21675 [Rhizomicrobium sp.]
MRPGTGGGKSPDTFLISKGHGCMIQYVILEDHGILSKADLDAYCTPAESSARIPTTAIPASRRPPDRSATAFRWSSAWPCAERGSKRDGIIYTVLSDGEIQEGSTWEAILMASSLKLGNIVAFVDKQRFPEPWPHFPNASFLLSADRQIRRVRLGDGRDRRSRLQGDL